MNDFVDLGQGKCIISGPARSVAIAAVDAAKRQRTYRCWCMLMWLVCAKANKAGTVAAPVVVKTKASNSGDHPDESGACPGLKASICVQHTVEHQQLTKC